MKAKTYFAIGAAIVVAIAVLLYVLYQVSAFIRAGGGL